MKNDCGVELCMVEDDGYKNRHVCRIQFEAFEREYYTASEEIRCFRVKIK